MFLDFFVNDVEANKVLNAERGVPVNTAVLAALEAEAEPARAAVYDYMARLGQDPPYSLVLDPWALRISAPMSTILIRQTRYA